VAGGCFMEAWLADPQGGVVRPSIRSSNGFWCSSFSYVLLETIKDFVLLGVGIAILPRLSVSAEIEDGRLILR
jgi:DNA-binding transcriptional LysR family regulator